MSVQPDAWITLQNVGWSTPEGEQVLPGVSLAIGNQRVGLVGVNGSGKTTLLRIMAGELVPTHGQVRVHGGVRYLAQQPSDQSDRLRVGEALGLAALGGPGETLASSELALVTEADAYDWQVAQRYRALIESFNLGHLETATPLGALSGGERTKVRLTKAFGDDPDLLLLDEPTNNLDAESRGALYELLEAWTKGALIATHDRALLRRVHHIFQLGTHGLESYGGDYDDYLEHRQVEEGAAQHQLKDAEREVARAKRKIQDTSEKHQRREARGRRARNTGSQPALVHNARRERAAATKSSISKTADRLLESAHDSLRRARDRTEERRELSLKLEATRVPAGKAVVQLEGVTVSIDGVQRLRAPKLSIIGAERVALVGPSGSGKTTLLRVIAGELPISSGGFTRGVDRIAYLDQHVRMLHDGETLLDGFRRHNSSIPVGESRIRLAHLKFLREDVFKRVAVLSGGERVRAGLACILFGEAPPQLLLLDEPTNHLDLAATTSIESALRAYEGALLVVSHDPDFVHNVGCERVIELG
ncbi:MAG: transporter [Myxococcaceae bacterium]|nr:transporter [Myxococcaceae bacterium]